MTLAERLHNVTHRHMLASKAGIGEFQTCAWRLSRNCQVYFRPEGYAPGWHRVPSGDGIIEAIVGAPDTGAAMALLHAEWM